MKDRRICIVTGAARGIGLGIAQKLAGHGKQLVLADVLFANPEICSSLKKAMPSGTALTAVDITSPAQVDKLIADTVESFGQIDGLVNAAGINRPCPVQNMNNADWSDVMAVNLTAAFYLSRAVSKQMISQRHGRIIHIGSTASRTSAAGLAAYSASKHGLIGLVRGMACDLAPFGITVNAVCPGNTETEMLDSVINERAQAQGRKPEELRAEMVRKTPLGRFGRPQDVAAAVLFLLSDEAAFITGQSLTVDGGRSLNLV